MQTNSASAASGEPSVAVVLLNWNDPRPTLACLEALRRLDYGNARFVVVDNGSGLDALQPLMALPDVELLCNGANLGFAGGVNVGLRHAFAANAEYVWLLNNDAIPTPGALKELVARAETEPSIGLLSPLLHDQGEAQRTNACFGLFDHRALGTTHTDDPGQARRWLAEHPADILAFGTALLIRRQLFEAIGGFDERLFAYAEDVDYCLRCTKAGFRVSFCFDAHVFHTFKDAMRDPDSCPPYLHYYISRNYPLLWRKLSGGPLLFTRAALWFLRQRLLQIDRIAGNQVAIDAALAGIWDGVLGRGGAYDPGRKPPWLLKQTLGRFPRTFISLLDGKLPIRSL